MTRRRRRRSALNLILGVGIAVVVIILIKREVSAGSFQTCVISRESGGNAQEWNAQGAPYWGLYQFGEALWTANGGTAADWGSASAAVQTEVFDNVMSHYDGCQNWTPSDHCPDPANGCP